MASRISRLTLSMALISLTSSACLFTNTVTPENNDPGDMSTNNTTPADMDPMPDMGTDMNMNPDQGPDMCPVGVLLSCETEDGGATCGMIEGACGQKLDCAAQCANNGGTCIESVCEQADCTVDGNTICGQEASCKTVTYDNCDEITKLTCDDDNDSRTAHCGDFMLAQPEPSDGARFGEAVAISADNETLAIGAPGAREGLGVVYIYDAEGLETPPSVIESPDQQGFGSSIEFLTSDVLAIRTDATVLSDPAVHIFQKEGTEWMLVNTIEPTEHTLLQGHATGFGRAIEYLDGTLYISAPQALTTKNSTGLVFVYNFDHTQPNERVQPVKLIPNPNPDSLDFGVALHAFPVGILVGSPEDGSGAIYGFASGVMGGFEPKFKCVPDKEEVRGFGRAILATNESAPPYLVSAPGSMSTAPNLFILTPEPSVQGCGSLEELAEPRMSGLGNTLAIYDSIAFAGLDARAAQFSTTAVSTNDRATPPRRFEPIGAATNSRYGASMDAGANMLVVGAPQQNIGRISSGAVFIYSNPTEN